MPPAAAAMVAVLVIAFLVGVMMTFVGQQLIRQAAIGAELVDTKVKSGEWRQALQSQPRIAAIADRIERQVNLPNAADSIANWLTAMAALFVKGSVAQALSFCLTFYLLFFFLRDRRAVLAACRSLSPLSDVETNTLLARICDTIYATIYGTLTVAAVQGILGGMMFWWLGLSAPLLWGLVMALLSIVPMAGSFVVWIPAAVFLAAEGSWGKAVILALWGALVVGTTDNLLRPILAGKRLKLHTVLIFVSFLGGLMFFGACGMILGPVILTITLSLLDAWHGRAASEFPGLSQ